MILAPHPAASCDAATPPRPERFVPLLLVLVVLAIYGQTVGFDFVAFDDPAYVYYNPHVRAGLSWAGLRWAWTTFAASNWHPLTWWSLMVDAQCYGLAAGGFHLTNVLLHALNALLLFRWLSVATGAWRPAAVVAFFFAAHPLHVESVAWVTERKDVLSTAFCFGTLLAYTRYVRACGPARGRAYGLALGLYALGLLAKPMLVSVPALLGLLDCWPLGRVGPGRWQPLGRLLVEKLPFALLAAASCAVTYAAQRTHAVVALGELPLGFRLVSPTLGVGTYLQKTFWPVGLSVFYPYWLGVSWEKPLAWGLVLAGLTVGALWQGRRRPWLAVGWLWFVGTLVPVCGLVQVGGQAVADRYTYLPHVGLFVALGWGAQEAWRRWERARAWLAVAGVAAALGCVGQAGWQAHYWRDGTTLFAHSAAVLPRPCSRLIRLQAIALTEAGGEEEAGMIDQPPRRLADDHHEAAERLARAWLGRDRPDQAIALLQPFAAFSHPDQQALELLADALAHAGRTADALAVGRRCARLYPQAGEAHFALADLLRHTGDAPAACVEYEAGLLREGENASALTYLAWAYAHFDDPDAHVRAGELARQAVDLAHGQDRVSLEALAAAEAALDRWPQAVAAAQQALAVTERAGEPADVTTACRARLASYQRGDLP